MKIIIFGAFLQYAGAIIGLDTNPKLIEEGYWIDAIQRFLKSVIQI